MSNLDQIIYSKQSLKDLRTLDKKTAVRIVKKLEENSKLQNPLTRAKSLQEELSNLYRYKVGNYRIIFDINKDGKIVILIILTIKHRKDIYKTKN